MNRVPSEYVVKPMSDEDLNKIEDYFQTLDVLMDALQRQVPAKISQSAIIGKDITGNTVVQCPRCREMISINFNYCPNCGQRIYHTVSKKLSKNT